MSITTTHARRQRRTTVAACAVAAAFGVALLVPTVGPAAAAAPPPAQAAVVAGPLMNYTVNATRANLGQTKKVERAVEAAGGSVITSYAGIGVVVAQSANANFAATVRTDKAVASAGATRTAPVEETDPTYGVADPLGPVKSRAGGNRDNRPQRDVEDATAPIADPLESSQWDMAAIGAIEAHEVTDGDPNVLVAVLDSGIEGTHPDLAPNIDQAASGSCLTGVADGSYESWQPTTSDHGTHVAGTIAAARNGVGMVGVAPNVRMSAVKVVNDDGFIYPEAAICGFMHATATGADVTNNSYYIDPWEFWCDSDVNQAAVKESVDRAIQYSQDRGVVNVAAAGNSRKDLANKTTDIASPNDTTPVLRQIDAGCEDIPTELDGVVTVSSTTIDGVKSSFSNYGLGVIDVAAPGTSILSTVTGGGYGLKSGTSMASPHVAGVVALLKSTHPRSAGTQLTDLLYAQADDVACHASGVQVCVGPVTDNGFFGEGLVDALDAVSATRR